MINLLDYGRVCIELLTNTNKMKKIIITIMFLPILVGATTIEEQYISALQQVITLLQQQVINLTLQLNQVLEQKNQVTELPVVASSTPQNPVVVPVYTPIYIQPTPPVLQQPAFSGIITNMEIILKDENNAVYGDSISIQSGIGVRLFINADYRVNDKSVLETIVMTSSDNKTRTMSKNERACGLSQMGGARNDCSANFSYSIENAGTYTVTFTAGETTKTLTINAQ